VKVKAIRMLSSAAPFGIFRADREGRWVYVNQRWSEMTDGQERVHWLLDGWRLFSRGSGGDGTTLEKRN